MTFVYDATPLDTYKCNTSFSFHSLQFQGRRLQPQKEEKTHLNVFDVNEGHYLLSSGVLNIEAIENM